MHGEIWGLFSGAGACKCTPNTLYQHVQDKFGKHSHTSPRLNTPQNICNNETLSTFSLIPKKVGGGGIDSATINYCCYKLDYTSDEIEKYKCWCLMGFFSSSLYNLTTWLQITTIWRAVFPNVSWAFGFAPWSMR